MSNWKDLREGWDHDVSVARGRAKPAVVALIAIAVMQGVAGITSFWQIELLGSLAGGQISMETLTLSDSVFQMVSFAQLGLLLVTGVLFLRWLAKTVTAARTMVGEPHLPWTASQAVWGFFIPFANLVRPYRVMRDLRDRLDPEGVPEPAPRPKLDGAAGYRRVEMKRAPPPAPLPHASIGAWWGLYLFGSVLDRAVAGTTGTSASALISNRRVIMLASAVEIGAAVLAVLMVRAIDGRLAERYRRVRHASKAELREWGLAPDR